MWNTKPKPLCLQLQILWCWTPFSAMAYAFLPHQLLTKILTKLHQSNVQLLFVVLARPAQPTMVRQVPSGSRQATASHLKTVIRSLGEVLILQADSREDCSPKTVYKVH